MRRRRWVARPGNGIGKDMTKGLCHQVQSIGTERITGGQVQTIEQAKQQMPKIVVTHGDGVRPKRCRCFTRNRWAVRGKICQRHHTPSLAKCSDDCFRDRSFVEGVWAIVCDPLQGFAEPGHGELRARTPMVCGSWRLPIRECPCGGGRRRP